MSIRSVGLLGMGALLAFACFATSPVLSAQQWLGFPGPAYEAGNSPCYLAKGDFNGDGVTDLVTANYSSDNVSVLLGEGLDGVGFGTFKPAVSYTAGDGPLGVSAGDFNGDGIHDLVVANSISDNLTVLFGNGTSGEGDGTFGAAVNYAAGDGCSGVTTSDFNSDGIADLAVANPTSNNLSILLGNGSGGVGNGTFGAAVNYGATGAGNVTTGDFNSDGITDLVASGFHGNISVLLGNGSSGLGDGTFQPRVSYDAESRPVSVTTGDFNSDGITDLAAASEETDKVSVLLGNGSNGIGNGTFQTRVTYLVGDAPQCVTTGDFNEDGITDLAVVNASSDSVSVLLGKGSGGEGDGSFEAASQYISFVYPVGLVTDDFNGDGITDIAAANNTSNNVSILLGNGSNGVGDGTFPSSARGYAGIIPIDVATADFNGDGIGDVASVNAQQNSVSVSLGGGNAGVWDGSLASSVSYDVGVRPQDVAIGDFNGDGVADLVTANQGTDNVSVLLGNAVGGVGNGTFQSKVNYAAGDYCLGLATGDFNEDGIVDLVTVNYSPAKVYVLLGNGDAGLGDGTFQPPVGYAAGSSPGFVTTGDVNSDGITDLVTSRSDYDSVTVLIGKGSNGVGNGTFWSGVSYGVGDGPSGVAVADFNGDGLEDIASSNFSSDEVTVLLRSANDPEGTITFPTRAEYRAGDQPTSIATADFNGDGLSDLATSNLSSHTISVFLGRGSGGVGYGTFQPPINYVTSMEPRCLTTGDFNGDGRPDLVTVGGSLNGRVSVIPNLGSREIIAPTGWMLYER